MSSSDITAPIVDHQTWNTCPDCGRGWPDPTPTPGLLHRTRLCASCAEPGRPFTRRRLQEQLSVSGDEDM
jgi:hypothetical protein